MKRRGSLPRLGLIAALLLVSEAVNGPEVNDAAADDQGHQMHGSETVKPKRLQDLDADTRLLMWIQQNGGVVSCACSCYAFLAPYFISRSMLGQKCCCL